MKSFGSKPFLLPMPVYMISTYNDDNTVDVMMMAWGGICDYNKVALNLDESHKTVKNIMKRKAFTVSVATAELLKESDYFGMVSANKVKDKFDKTNLTITKSTLVDAPIINEYPVTLECELFQTYNDDAGFRVVGKILNVVASNNVLDKDGNIDINKVKPVLFDQVSNSYYSLGEYLGKAWNIGKEITK